MANGQQPKVLQHLGQILGTRHAGQTDGQLLQRFINERDEAAFAALLQRHGPMVLGVCRRVLRGGPDVDDAFQATFLVLLRKASSIVRQESVGSWLHGVAHRIAVRARITSDRRQRRERQVADMPQEAPEFEDQGELRSLLDTELLGLPEKYRAPLVLHYLEGKTKDQTARELGWPVGTVSGRLARGRQLLRARLARRGLALSAGTVALGLSQNVAPAVLPAPLVEAMLRAAAAHLARGAVAGVVSLRAASLAEEALRALFLTKLKVGVTLLLAVGLLAALALAVYSALLPEPPLWRPVQSAKARVQRTSRPGPDQKARPRTDSHGDPLPAAALARAGTVRGWHARGLNSLAFALNGKLLATRASDGIVRLWETTTGKPVCVLRGAPGVPWSGFWCFALAPGGTVLATGGGDDTIRFWDVATGKQLHQVKGNHLRGEGNFPLDYVGGITALAYSTNGRFLATCGEDSRICVWDATRRTLQRRFGPGGGPLRLQGLAFSSDNKTLATIRAGFLRNDLNSYLALLELWDATTGARLGQVTGRTLPLFDLAFSPDGRRFAWREQDEVVSLREVATLKEIRRFKGGEIGHRGLAFLDGGRTLALASPGSVRLWDVASGKLGRVLKSSGRALCLAASGDGKTLAAGTEDGDFQLWDVATGKGFPRPTGGHHGQVNCVVYAPDGKTLATSCLDGNIRLWETATGKQLRSWPDHSPQEGASCPWGLAFAKGGKLLASGGTDGMLRIWDASTGKEIRHFPGKQGSQGHYCLEFSPDGRLLASRDSKGAVCLWTARGKEVRVLQAGDPGDFSPMMHRLLAFSPNGKYLASTRRGVIHLWEIAAGKESRRLAEHHSVVTAITFSSDSNYLASASDDGELRWTEIATGKECGRVARALGREGRLDPINLLGPSPRSWVCAFAALAFSPDGRSLMGGCQDGTIYVWDLTSGRLVKTGARHRDEITSLALSPDGKKVASSSADTTVLVWDVAALCRKTAAP